MVRYLTPTVLVSDPEGCYSVSDPEGSVSDPEGSKKQTRTRRVCGSVSDPEGSVAASLLLTA